MKTFIFSALALGVMAGCSNTEIEDVVDNGEPVAIRLIAGVQVSAASRSVIDEEGTFTASVFGWNVTKDVTIDYTKEPVWTSETESITAKAEGGVGVELVSPQFYHAQKDTKTYMKAISPMGGSILNAVYTFNPVLTEQDDVLLTKGDLSGDRINSTVNLSFSHILARFNFQVALGTNFDAGVTITNILVKGATLAESVNLNTGMIVPKAAADINISGNGVEIEVPAAAVGNPIMMVPCRAESLTLDIETSAGKFENIKITPKNGSDFVAGTSYTITLTFNGKSVGATSAVGKWTDDEGSGTVN